MDSNSAQYWISLHLICHFARHWASLWADLYFILEVIQDQRIKGLFHLLGTHMAIGHWPFLTFVCPTCTANIVKLFPRPVRVAHICAKLEFWIPQTTGIGFWSFWMQQTWKWLCSKLTILLGGLSFLNRMFSRLSRIIVNTLTGDRSLPDRSWAPKCKKIKIQHNSLIFSFV